MKGSHLIIFIPEIAVLSLALLLLIFDWVTPKGKKVWIGYFSAVMILVFMGGFLCLAKNRFFPYAASFHGFVFDAFALYFKELFLLVVFLATLFSVNFFKQDDEGQGEYYALLLFVTLGCFLLVSSADLLMLFLSFEMMSIPLYVMCAYRKKDSKSSESGLKYFLIGAITSALLLYGISLVYAATGTTNLHAFIEGLVSANKLAYNPILLLGLILMLCAFCFKIAAVPFHMWAPDVYEGAPAPVVAFLAVSPKIAVIGLMTRLFLAGMQPLQPFWVFLFAVLAAFTMTVGNLTALFQQNLKRLLAYSGIAQIGYILVGFASIQPFFKNMPTLQLGYQAILFYLAAYLFSDLAAFGIVTYLSAHGIEDVKSLKGLAEKNPMIAFLFLISLLSLAGVPPLVGFVGKFYLFLAAVSSRLYWLALLGVVNSVISLFYYLRVARTMYFEKEEGVSIPYPSFSMQVALLVAVLGILIIGIYPFMITHFSLQVLTPLSNVPISHVMK